MGDSKKHNEPWYKKDEFEDSDKNVEERLMKFKSKIKNRKDIKNKFAYALGMLKKSYGK
jgi:hypothetical protein